MTNQPTPRGTGLPPGKPCTDPRHTGAIREQLGCNGPDPAQEQPAADVFTEAAVARSALLAGISAVEGMVERDPWKTGASDAVEVLRRLADHYVTNEQPSGLTWEARTEHAVRLYAVTAIERDDALAAVATLRTKLAELEQPEATHEGPDPSHGGLTTHRGTRENCSGPDCGPAEDDTPTGQRYPCGLGVYCDSCGTEFRGDFIVVDTMTKAERLEVVRNHVRTAMGWQCDATGDYCPTCKPTEKDTPTGESTPTTTR